MKTRPEILESQTGKYKLTCGSLYITVTQNDGQPFEVFVHFGKAGGCLNACLTAVSKLISIALRSGIDPQEIVDGLKGLSCPESCWVEQGRIESCPDAIAQYLARTTTKGGDIEQVQNHGGDILSAETDGPGDCGDSRF